MPAFSTNETTGLAWLLTRWSRELARAIGQTGRSLPVTEIADSGETPRGAGSLWRAQRLSFLEAPCIWIGTAESAWKVIGEAAGAAKETADSSEIGSARDVYSEILTQAFSGLATVLTERLGNEITCPPGEEIPAPPDDGERCFVDVRIGDGEPVRICLIASNQLLKMLGHGSSLAGAKNTPDNMKDGEPGVAAFTSVLDVELPVSVSLGTTRLDLEEVLKIGEGSVIPLGREASELVIVRVNGRVVARGEIVVVRGNYGVRIRELSSLSERLQELNSIRWPQSADAAAY